MVFSVTQSPKGEGRWVKMTIPLEVLFIAFMVPISILISKQQYKCGR